MVNSPIVSVIITAYNAEKHVADAIESIRRQTLKNIEIIVIDDGSTDSTRQILQEISDKRVIILPNSENMHQSYSRNKGIQSSTGKYIAIMDADDIAHPQRLEKQVNYLENHPEISLCGSWVDVIDEEDNVKYTRKLPEDDATIKLKLLFGCPIVHPTVMWRKADFQNHNLWYDEYFVYAQDFDLWTRAMWHLNFHIIDEPLLSFRFRNKDSISLTKVDKQKEFANEIIERNIKMLTGMTYAASSPLLSKIRLYRRIANSSFLAEKKPKKVQFLRKRILSNSPIPYRLKTIIRQIAIP